MVKMNFAKKRMIGATLAALTVVAGMSAVAFAGEPALDGGKVSMEPLMPAVKSTVNAAELTDCITVTLRDTDEGTAEMASLITLPAAAIDGGGEAVAIKQAILIKVDEETGVMYDSVDEGATWNPVIVSDDGQENFIDSVATTKALVVEQ